MKRSLFLVVEGVDLSGKTATCELLISKMKKEGVLTKKNYEGYSIAGKFARKARDCKLLPVFIKDIFFIFSYFFDTFRIWLLLKKGITVVQDRYYTSYLCFHLCLADAIKKRKFNFYPLLKVLKVLFIQPDFIIFCKCQFSTLKKRYSEKADKHYNDIVLFSGEFGDTLEQYYKCFELILKTERGVIEISNDGTLQDLDKKVSNIVFRILEKS